MLKKSYLQEKGGAVKIPQKMQIYGCVAFQIQIKSVGVDIDMTFKILSPSQETFHKKMYFRKKIEKVRK